MQCNDSLNSFPFGILSLITLLQGCRIEAHNSTLLLLLFMLLLVQFWGHGKGAFFGTRSFSKKVQFLVHGENPLFKPFSGKVHFLVHGANAVFKPVFMYRFLFLFSILLAEIPYSSHISTFLSTSTSIGLEAVQLSFATGLIIK